MVQSTEGFNDLYVPINKLMGFPAPLTGLFDSAAMECHFLTLSRSALMFMTIMPFQETKHH